MGVAALDGDLREILLQEDARLALGVHAGGVEGHLDDFGLAVGVGREVDDLRAGQSAGHVILAVAGHR